MRSAVVTAPARTPGEYPTRAVFLVSSVGEVLLELHCDDKVFALQLPCDTAQPLLALAELHVRWPDPQTRLLRARMSGKDLAKEVGLEPDEDAAIRQRVARIRKAIRTAVGKNDSAYHKTLRAFIVSRPSWGYMIHPYTSVEIRRVSEEPPLLASNLDGNGQTTIWGPVRANEEVIESRNPGLPAQRSTTNAPQGESDVPIRL